MATELVPPTGPDTPTPRPDARNSGMTPEKAVEQIASDLHAAGLPRGAAVLVHSSMKSLGPVPGGPETAIRGFLQALGPDGTLLLPGLSYKTVNADNPVFDVVRTPSCIGALAEYFRKRSGTLRSINPTHSVCAVGAKAARLLGEHQLDDTPCGAHSPFHLLREEDGYVLFLGCGTRPNTSMHAIEEVIMPPYLFGGMITYTAILSDGKAMPLLCRRHSFAGFGQRYDRIEALLKAPDLRIGRVLLATMHLLRCRPMWDRALDALRRDPLHFVERVQKTLDDG
jgi:aminoglycoside 3-N-acetyltransferase